MSTEKVSYLGLSECIKLSNGEIDLIAATAIGPRILFYGPRDGENVLGEHSQSEVKTALGIWKPYAGHRLWVWPELFPATYAPDNEPVEAQVDGELSLTLTQAEDTAGIEKQIRIELSVTGTGVKLTHKITSRNLWPIEVAPWAITVVSSGTAIVPRVPFESHDENVTAAQPLVFSTFTDLQDPRFLLGSRYILLSADRDRPGSQKFGLLNKQGWCAHLVHDSLFVKRFPLDERANYPDYGVNNEVYVEGLFMEVELLGPITVLGPGQSVLLTEEWNLFKKVGVKDVTDLEHLHRTVDPLIQTLFN